MDFHLITSGAKIKNKNKIYLGIWCDEIKKKIKLKNEIDKNCLIGLKKKERLVIEKKILSYEKILFPKIVNILNFTHNESNNQRYYNYIIGKWLRRYIMAFLNNAEVFINCGQTKINKSLKDTIKMVEKMGAGELMINSIDRDGVGYGYDVETLKEVNDITNLPIIPCGGADNHIHLHQGIETTFLHAVSTSHIFNFMGEGLKETKELLIKRGYNFVNWDYENLRLTNEKN